MLLLPNVVAEAANLLGQISEPGLSVLRAGTRQVVDVSNETSVLSKIACADKGFARLGLTDAAILHLATPLPLLTDDLGLFLAAIARGLSATKFSQVRDAAPE